MTSALDFARCVALRLEERLTGTWPRQNAENATEGEPLTCWRSVFGSGEAHAFDRRLQWDGLDEHRAAELIMPPQEPPIPIAPWATFLADVCEVPSSGTDRSEGAPNPIAFEEVLSPFVQVARVRLRQVVPDIDQQLLAQAQVSSERALLRQLSAAAGQTLFAHFAAERAVRGGPGLGLGGPPRSQYHRFVRALREAHLQPLIERRPVLARLLAVRAAFWVEVHAEFVKRLAADRGDLSAIFGIDPLAKVAHLKTGLGESHCGGRSVFQVRFTSEAELMYKPRPLSIDVAFYGFLEWLNQRGLAPCQKTLRVLDRDAYGWVEVVKPMPMSDERQVQSYFERAGGLLAVAYVLGSTDLHAGNVIAAGPDPIPVDLETIMGPSALRPPGDPADNTLPRRSRSNVLGTRLLPFWLMKSDGGELREGGIGGGTGNELSVVVKAWRHTNTDWMAQREEVRVARGSHRARKGVEIPTPVDHMEDVVRGFERGYALMRRYCADIVSERGPLAAFRGCRVRVILRDTRAYFAALRRGLHPKHLKDGLDHSLQFEVLKSPFLAHSDPIGFWPALASEQRDLENLDYPQFSMATDGFDLYDAQGRTVGPFSLASPHASAMERVARLSDDDQRHQVALIRFSFACLSSPAAPGRRNPDDEVSPEALNFATEARRIGSVIESLVVRDPSGPACWVGRQWTGRGREAELRRLDHTLYDGSIGVALFLVALDTVEATGHGDLAVEALLPLRNTLRNTNELANLVDRRGIGIAKGIGGIIYTLTQIGRMTGDVSWVDDAQLAAHAIDLRRIRSETVTEVLGGASGALLSLLSLHALAGKPAVLKQATECGEHILARVGACSGEGGLGFAHGAGGVSSALARLARVTGDERFATASVAGLRQAMSNDNSALEDGPPEGEGRTPVAEAPSSWVHTWCHGNVGTELGHIRHGVGPLPASSIAPVVAKADLSTTDHPCCGNLGRAELLLSAGQADLAADLATRVIDRAFLTGSYEIGHGIPDARWVPGFFQGLSGIGYQLLRMSAAEALPCLLAFE